jgi:16S rRNA (guanine527-N7)-methyltransferase
MMKNVSMLLNDLLSTAGIGELNSEQAGKFETYLHLLMRWNGRVNLTAIRDEEGILSRHFVESIACARKLPVEVKTLLDFGSGGGFPGIPIALCRPELAVTLAESQGKKAAFLAEAVRTLELAAKVHAGRAEQLNTVFDCVVLRAVDKMAEAVKLAERLVAKDGWLALMTTETDRAGLCGQVEGKFEWKDSILLPGGQSRILSLGRRVAGL